MTESMDPYLYPGTNVLKNLRDIRNPGTLACFEAEATTRRIVELIHSPAQGQFDTAHLRAIHRRIFQDVYEWAGQFRTVYISKDGHLFGLLVLSRVPCGMSVRSCSGKAIFGN